MWPFTIIGRWLRKRRRRRSLALMRFWDGERFRYADPFLVWRRIYSDPDVDLQAIAPLADAGHEPEATQAIDLIARAFEVQRFDEATQTGLTDWEICGLLNDMDAYMEAVKKKYNFGPISPEPTASESSISPEPPTETPKPSSGSGSVAEESKPAEVSEI